MSTTVAVHVPAWKKIGLKLKKAGDEPEVTAVKDAVSEVKAHDDGEDRKERKRKKKERKEKEKREKAESASASASAAGDKPAEDQAEEAAKEKKKKKKDKKSKSSTSASESTTTTTTTTPAPSTPTPTPAPAAAKPPSTDPKPLLLRHPRAPPTSRKSVTFTSDTKATDGDSIKTLYQNHDPFAHYDSYQQHLANYPSSSAANELPAGFDDVVEPKKGAEIQYKFGSTGKRKKFSDDDEVDATAAASAGGAGGVKDATLATTTTTTTTTTKQRKEKETEKATDKTDTTTTTAAPSPKKRKPNPPKPSTAPTANTAPYLHYLTAHHLHRATWKFEKSKQNWILRHAFDSAQIPATHDAALRGYIASVQGAAARDRLLEAANEVVKRGSDTISRDGEKVDVVSQREGVGRAKLVLAALGHGEDDEEEEEEGSGSSDSSSDCSSDSDSSDGGSSEGEE